ncbi:cysteine/serine endopeptidase inhibitor [Streptomyces sp. NPDC050848]|uniref:cysteine/serine endopeptidase inhibitor n=1 Tax=Streptomyces sp. NPDC050848 TaxID=3155791 RepID=UPI0033E74748
MNARRHRGTWAAGLLGAVSLALLGTGPATAAEPAAEPRQSKMTWYDLVGNGACGTPVDATAEDLVAVSYAWWTEANPNNDSLCKEVYVEVSYNGRTITVPVRDKCPECPAEHIDLSKTAFEKLAPLDQGVADGISWKFVHGDGGEGEAVSAATAAAPETFEAPEPLAPVEPAVDVAPLPAPQSVSWLVEPTDSGCAVGPGWDAGRSYEPGETVTYAGEQYTATFYSTGATPGDPISWAVWQHDGPC